MKFRLAFRQMPFIPTVSGTSILEPSQPKHQVTIDRGFNFAGPGAHV